MLVAGSSFPEASNKVELFDVKNNKLILLPDLNVGRSGLCALTFREKAYLFSDDSIESLVIDPWWANKASAQKTWTKMDLKMPALKFATMIELSSDKVLILGGEVYPGVINYQKFTVNLTSGKV